MEALSEDKVTATFDHLVQEGVIAYGPSTVIDVDANGYPVSHLKRLMGRADDRNVVRIPHLPFAL